MPTSVICPNSRQTIERALPEGDWYPGATSIVVRADGTYCPYCGSRASEEGGRLAPHELPAAMVPARP